MTLLLSEALGSKCWGKKREKLPTTSEFPAFGWDESDPPDKTNGYISSIHPGGSVVSFCDGHQHFLKDNVEYEVYKQLLSPHGAGCTPPMTSVLGDDSF